MPSELLQDLEWRGLVQDVSDRDALDDALARGGVTLYCGYDPTAPSLHVGHLQMVLTLRRFQLAGNTPIALAGGGTGLIGDPSGKAGERAMNPPEVVADWADRIAGQMETLLPRDDGVPAPVFENNLSWLGELKMVDLLRDTGKHFSVSVMIARESVAARIGEGGSGMSFTEFSYQVLQSYDFQELYDRHGCRLQIGGSDQWGNITAGLDLLRRTGRPGAFGLTSPLMLRSDGKKFGKTEDGAVWLDPELTSPFAFYQYFLTLPDADAPRMLRRLSLKPREEIEDLERDTEHEPQKRAAQRALADELTTLVHGEEGRTQAEEVSAWLFGGRELSSLQGAEIERALRGGPVVPFSAGDLESWERIALHSGLVPSLSEARRTIAGGGFYYGDERVTPERPLPTAEELADAGAVVLRKGKRHRVVAVPAD